MELKYWYTPRTFLARRFKSHLYGIEIEEEHHGTPSAPGLNRTFMELKSKAVLCLEPLASRLNRTFMELK